MPSPDWTADNITEVTILGRWTNGRPVVNVFMIQREEDNAADSARDVLNNWQDHIMERVLDNYTLEGARYRDRNEAAGVVGTLAPDPAKNVVGQDSSPSLSPNTSVLVRKVPGELHAGERAGRLYICGASEQDTDENGLMTVAYQGLWQAQVDDFLSGLSGAGGNQLALVHLIGPTASVGTVSLIESMPVQRQLATSRRRLRK